MKERKMIRKMAKAPSRDLPISWLGAMSGDEAGSRPPVYLSFRLFFRVILISEIGSCYLHTCELSTERGLVF